MKEEQIPIFDNHLHLDLDGHCVEAAKDFERAGGTALMIVDKPKWDMIRSREGLSEQYTMTLRIADMVREETGLKVFVTLGPHPALLTHFIKSMELDEGEELMRAGVDLAADLVEEEKVVSIGEVGRPHFPVPEEVMGSSNRIMEYAMERARDVGCPVTLHTESSTEETYRMLANTADRVGIARDKVIKHFSPPIVDTEKNHGLFPSIVSSRKAIRKALGQGDRFLMETDYLDDLKRPGAVMGPKTVPKRTKQFLEEGVMTVQQAFEIHQGNPESIYDIEILR